MTVTSMASFVEAKREKEKEALKFWKSRSWRYLGGRVHIANQDYECTRCIFSIVPGEEYQRDVYANYQRIKVEKFHYPQCYGPSEEDDREIREQMEREREEARIEAARKAA